MALPAQCVILDSKEGKLMRHERGINRIQLNFGGESLKEKAAPGYCDLDFIYGNVNTDQCDQRAHFPYSNLTEDECIYAATRGGAHTRHDSFEVGPAWQDVHPKGCFVFPCGTEWCYYANEIGDQPMGQHLGGVPVCRRDRYIYGNAEAEVATDPSICNNPEYEVVLTEAACIQAASCLGDCDGAPFDIGINNASKRLEFPAGCFLHADDSFADRPCVFWNNPNWTTSFAPSEPKGSPICVVKNPDNVGQLKRSDFITGAGGNGDSSGSGGSALITKAAGRGEAKEREGESKDD